MAIEKVRSYVVAHSGLSLAHLDERFVDRDLLNFCLARGHLAFDLDDVPLTRRGDVVVFAHTHEVTTARALRGEALRCAAPVSVSGLLQLKPFARISIDGVAYQITAVEPAEIRLCCIASGAAETYSRSRLERLCREERIGALVDRDEVDRAADQLVRTMSARDQAMIVARFDAIRTHVAFHSQQGPKPRRSLTRNERRWLAAYLAACRRKTNPMLALLPRISERGCTKSIKGAPLRERFFRTVEELSAANHAPSAREVWRQLQTALRDAGEERESAISYETVRRWVNELNEKPSHVARRFGSSAAYRRVRSNLSSTQLCFVPDTSHVEYVVDSTQVDLRVCSEVTGEVIATRLSITLMIDSFSGRITGFWLYLGKPDCTSIMLALAAAYARFERLPERVLVDNGKEFDNETVRSALAALDITMDYRVAQCYGSGHRVENAFSRLAAMLDDLPGNVKVVKSDIVVSNENDPCDHAKYTLFRFQQLMELWCYEKLDLQPLPNEGVAPRAKCAQASREHGHLLGRLVLPSFFHAIINSTLAARTITYCGGSTGFRIDGYCYDNRDLPAGLIGKKFNIYPDPRDARRAHVFIGQQWYELRCRVLELSWRDMPAQQVWAYSQELRDAQKNPSAQTAVVQRHFELKRQRLEAESAADIAAHQVAAARPSTATSSFASKSAQPSEQMEIDFQDAKTLVSRKRQFERAGTRLRAAPMKSGPNRDTAERPAA